MLVVSRKAEEGIQLGQNIHITVLSIRSDHVKLGVRAPTEIPILRSELIDRVRLSNLRSSEFDPRELLGQGLLKKTPPVHLKLPSPDLEGVRSFYLKMGFESPDQLRPFFLKHPRGLELEFYEAAPLAKFSFVLSAESKDSWVDPNGYEITI